MSTSQPVLFYKIKPVVRRRIEERRGSRIAVVAVARELTGFVWAVLQDVDFEADLQQETAA